MRYQDLPGQLADALFPPECALCGTQLAGGRICPPCHRDLPWNERACPSCAEPKAPGVPADLLCGRCQARSPPFRSVVAPLLYTFPIDAVLKGLKFHNKLDVAPMLAELLAPAVRDSEERLDALVPVPLHRWRHARRGYNQAGEIARALSRLTGVPVRRLVTRVRATSPQTGLDAKSRRRNLRGAFHVRRRAPAARVLVIDDVITTGETVRAVAGALQASGIDEVRVLAVARAAGGPGVV